MASHRLTPASTDESARQAVATGCDDGPCRPFCGRSLVELLDVRAEQAPDHLAYMFLRDGEIESERYTWRTLRQRSVAIAAHVRTCLMPGDRALLLYPPGLEFVAAFFGCAAAGVIAVPLAAPAHGRDSAAMGRLRAIAASAAPAAVLTTVAYLARWAACAGAGCSGTGANGPEIGWPGSPRIHVVATDAVPLDMAPARAPFHPDADNLALLQYTSGSTALPKGVMISHANLLHNLSAAFRLSRDASARPSVSWLPVTHDMGLIEGVLQPAFRGHAAYLMSPAAFLQRPVRWLAAISKYGAARSGGPNFAYDLCVRRVAPDTRHGLDLCGWNDAYNGAEPVRPETLASFAEAFAGCGFRRAAFRPCYGLAEATLVVSAGQWDGETVGPVSCGPVADGTDLVVVDPDTRTPCADGQSGEIWIRGAGVSRGYWNQSEETAATFGGSTADGRDGFLRSGDLGTCATGDCM